MSNPVAQLSEAKRRVRKWKREGRRAPPEQLRLFGGEPGPLVRHLAEENRFAEPWATYIARFQSKIHQRYGS